MTRREITATWLIGTALLGVMLSFAHNVIPRQIGLVECSNWQERPVFGNLGGIALQIKQASGNRVDADLLEEKIANRNGLLPKARQVYSGQSLLVPDICNLRDDSARLPGDLARPMVELLRLLD